jgi:hypothetical protein
MRLIRYNPSSYALAALPTQTDVPRGHILAKYPLNIMGLSTLYVCL